MNVFEITQSFQSVVETISTTNPTDQYVSKDLFQTCMASFANNIIELVQSVNQLSWKFNSGIQTLSNKLDSLEETTEILQTNYSNISEKITSMYSNNIKVLYSLKQLSDRVENTEKMNKQNITMLFEKIDQLEASNSKMQNNIKGILDRLQNAESEISGSHQTTVNLTKKVSEICGSVDDLHNYSSILLSNYKTQQCSIDSLTNDVTKLQDNSTQLISHSTPKPPPGIFHRNISNTQFFMPKTPPGFENVFMPHSYTTDQSTQFDIMTSGEISPPFNSVGNTELGPETPVSHTDRDGTIDLPPVSAAPSKSITVSPTHSVTTEGSTVSNKISLQLSESKMPCTTNRSDDTPRSNPDVSHTCQSFDSYCDSGIVSMLDQTSQLPPLVQTESSLSVKSNTNPNQSITHITPTTESLHLKTEEESNKEFACSNVSPQSTLVESSDSTGKYVSQTLTPDLTSPYSSPSNITSVEGQNPVISKPTLEMCGEASKSLTVVPCGYSEQSAVSPVKSFEQVIQSEGHTEYGRLHPVRRPWKLMYLTLLWLKPFK